MKNTKKSNSKKYFSYEELLKMEDGKKAVMLLFARAQKDYLALFEEMIKQEKKHHTLEKSYPKKPKPGKDIIFDSFTRKEAIDNNIQLYSRTVDILGDKDTIPNHENMFFDLLFYKFVADHKFVHGK